MNQRREANIPNSLFGSYQYSSNEAQEVRTKLNLKLGPEYISQRSGPGGSKVSYLEGWKATQLANDIFGFNGWSSTLVDITVDFVDVDNGKVSMGISSVVRVTLKDGSFHEDVGYGSIENARSKAQAFEKAKKEAVTDATKRALKHFGNSVGSCLYDKDFLRKVSRMSSQPTKPLAPDELYRHPDYRTTGRPSNGLLADSGFAVPSEAASNVTGGVPPAQVGYTQAASPSSTFGGTVATTDSSSVQSSSNITPNQAQSNPRPPGPLPFHQGTQNASAQINHGRQTGPPSTNPMGIPVGQEQRNTLGTTNSTSRNENTSHNLQMNHTHIKTEGTVAQPQTTRSTDISHGPGGTLNQTANRPWYMEQQENPQQRWQQPQQQSSRGVHPGQNVFDQRSVNLQTQSTSMPIQPGGAKTGDANDPQNITLSHSHNSASKDSLSNGYQPTHTSAHQGNGPSYRPNQPYQAQPQHTSNNGYPRGQPGQSVPPNQSMHNNGNPSPKGVKRPLDMQNTHGFGARPGGTGASPHTAANMGRPMSGLNASHNIPDTNGVASKGNGGYQYANPVVKRPKAEIPGFT
ncbi:recombination protein rad52, variant [Spizellomyces punctatus DAOM BR117]|uniref:Recombination protein rad52, variant n=1 Tax=Spizellomyces punctatus (strain DAOM BR117) TaxID=645134 RepID=A0A0L0HHR8_SPIPD|nr:recombination protein rad52, variant [Spizellomyces punctatus DAOM BR117]KND00623.1 recombination protein rad52, variant [Spizellomyces punctatus DAOM BR117]|eukprot:XP_016608662.1 recombination protein rad52, variant [Spizellomyces punctatus DAOM BR117]